MNDFSVGDRVYLSDDAVPAELRGLTGTVAAMREDAVHVSIQGAPPVSIKRRSCVTISGESIVRSPGMQ